MSDFDFEWVKSVERRWSTSSEDSGVALTRCVAEIERLQHCFSEGTLSWVALAERKPEGFVTCLVFPDEDGGVGMDTWMWNGEPRFIEQGVTHWMPIPEGPK